jgi:hypothetical protein
MADSGLFDAVPLWGFLLLVLLLVLLSVEAGYRLGKFRRLRSEDEKEEPVAAMAAAALGLLAFLLAFTFDMAASRFEARKQVLLNEANAIGTTWLRAELLPEGRDEVRARLRDYVQIRLAAVRSGEYAQARSVTEQLHAQLWKHAVDSGKRHPGSIIAGLYIESLNQMIDLHATRVAIAVRARIPPTIWIALMIVSITSFGMVGYHSGLSRTSRSPAGLAIAFIFAAVITLITDLDRPQDGSLVVSQQPLIDLLTLMRADLP